MYVLHLDDGHGNAACCGEPLPAQPTSGAPTWPCSGCTIAGENAANRRIVARFHTMIDRASKHGLHQVAFLIGDLERMLDPETRP